VSALPLPPPRARDLGLGSRNEVERVTNDRLMRILARLEDDHESGYSSGRLCDVSTDIIGVSGAGVMLMSGDLPLGSLCTTNAISAAIEDLQYTLGEGPCVDAYRLDQVVLEPNLAAPIVPRWLAFRSKALDAGVRAVFGFPLRVGAARLGAMNLYQDRPGPLSDDQHADALVMTDVIAHWVLDTEANTQSRLIDSGLALRGDFHFVVHNASGAVAVQLGVSVTEAMIRLRAYAFSNERPLGDVARDVIDRKLRFE
jgi:GAF domain-containing protein